MIAKNYEYEVDNYPRFSGADFDQARGRIVMDAYWDATNLKDIIEKSYDTSVVRLLPNQMHEVVFALVALACELFLKSLIYFDKKQATFVRKHDLLSLFLMLSDALKDRLVELVGDFDFEHELANNKDTFIHFRYSYEMKGYRVNAAFLIQLMNSLHKLCNEVYPSALLDGVGNMVRVGLYANGINYRIEVE